ncbi:ABC transporter ATP-binding protein [Flaviaesturariibacter aridisoli]|uniref:ABC transporter ATP-binding protein n=1 Tax=Flaviaesturariibacter aridisoli TaxID=2545761 RepID=A0A4R4DZU5_9BACT|nr:ABC transporter ATP-binding protein [Flaviaesturariibacter aridisoli]TCZ66936.1 ABC transporter ATP-binding protein [Flaviaesturariibacter aridisoli]
MILEARHINKYFHDPVTTQVLRDVSFGIGKGEFVSVTGKSGCGKSTLLYILSTMDTDYDGELLIDGESMTKGTARQLARVRNEKIGFVFQFHYLLNEFSVLKNVMLPALKLKKYPVPEIEHRALERLRWLGIEALALKGAHQVSGGEKQRVAIARALINDPHIIMGDEPTGNLDKNNSDLVFDIFHRLSQERGQTLLIVTHDPSFAERTGRTIHMEDGQIKGG